MLPDLFACMVEQIRLGFLQQPFDACGVALIGTALIDLHPRGVRPQRQYQVRRNPQRRGDIVGFHRGRGREAGKQTNER